MTTRRAVALRDTVTLWCRFAPPEDAILRCRFAADNERMLSSRGRYPLFSDLTFELYRFLESLLVSRLHQKGVEAAAMVDSLEGIRRDAQPHRAAERVRDHRHVEQIGQKAPLGFDVRVAHFMSNLGRLAGQIAA